MLTVTIPDNRVTPLAEIRRQLADCAEIHDGVTYYPVNGTMHRSLDSAARAAQDEERRCLKAWSDFANDMRR